MIIYHAIGRSLVLGFATSLVFIYTWVFFDGHITASLLATLVFVAGASGLYLMAL